MPSLLADIAVSTNPAQPVRVLVPALVAGTALTSYGQPASGAVVLNQDQSFTYTPVAGFTGTDEFTYSLQDLGLNLASGRVMITVARVNTAPTTVDDMASTMANTATTIAVLANDNDPDGDPLTISAITMPAHGAINIQPDQTLRYEPQSGFLGSDSFVYTVADGKGGTASGQVSVAVTSANQAPVTRSDLLTTQKDTPATIAVLSNDRDPDGDPLTLLSLGLPAFGNLSVNPDQSVTYTPKAGYFGDDEFTYTVTDGRGGIADGKVSVDVRRPNQRPIVISENVTTVANRSITIPVLANDTDPDADPLTIVAIGLPSNGTLAVNPDQTVTYAPGPNYVGADEFTYTVTDGWGARVTGRVSVTVNEGRPTIFANGYSYRRQLVVPAAQVQGQHTGFPLWARVGGDYLKPKSAGGKLEAGANLDVRFELEDGTKLAHDVDDYDFTTGRLSAWVRLPLLSGDADNRLYFYYGKAGVATSEAAPAAVWADYLAVWHLPSLADRGPNGRDLSKSGAVNNDPDGLVGSARFGSAGALSLADTAWLSGLSGLTVQLRSKADAVGTERGVINCGAFGTDPASALTLRYGGNQGSIIAKLKTSAGDATLTTVSGVQNLDWQSMALSWAAGDAQLGLYINGAAASVAQAGSVPTANTTVTAISGALVLGAGSRDTAAGGWQGLIDEVRVRSGKLAVGWLAAEYLNQSGTDRFYGTGSEDSPDDIHASAVAVPLAGATLANSWVDFNVLGRAYVPDGAYAPTVTAVGQPANGVATAVGDQIRYTPTTGFFGTDSFTYTISSGPKRSTARITVSVEPVNVGLPKPKNTIPVSSAGALATALANAKPGDHILLANGTYSGNFNAYKAGTATDPIVIRSVSPLGAKIKGGVGLNASYVWLWGVWLDGTAMGIQGDGIRVSRCKQNDTAGIALVVAKGKNIEIDRNEFSGMKERGISLKPDPANPTLLQNVHVHHNWLHDWFGQQGENVHEGMQLGQTASNTDISVRALVEWNLFENVGVDPEAISIKSSDNVVRFNTILNCTAAIENRHGERNEISGNWIENSQGIRLHDRGHKVIGNRLVNTSQGLRVMAGDITADQFGVASGTHWAAAENVLVSGNNANKTEIGSSYSTPWGVPSKNTRIEAHTGPVTKKLEIGTTQVATASVPIPVARKLSRVDVGPDSA